MANIAVLDQETINQIAAGEVIERPASVVKELLENAIDAGATAVTVEIKDGGLTFIRVTDNGCGIPKGQIPLAFLRHSTSKIKSVEDLIVISSLGFRGEALSSIAAVSQVELITKVEEELTGSRYLIDGGAERSFEEVGAPEGTTFVVRNLFYNTPARRKFLKTSGTEGAHVADLVEKIALSRPDISIRLIQNNQNKLHTSGNHNLKDIIYTLYGREIAANLLPLDLEKDWIRIHGYVGKPLIARSNRSFENYFINGRYIKSSIIGKALEEAFRPYLMQHKYPFAMLHFAIEPEFMDVNVHPSKMELRFKEGETVYRAVTEAVEEALGRRELIPSVTLDTGEGHRGEEKKEKTPPPPEPFEKIRLETVRKEQKPSYLREESRYETSIPANSFPVNKNTEQPTGQTPEKEQPPQQMDLFGSRLLEPEARSKHKLIGQLFDTYWLVEYDNQLYIIDQHAAHEKVLYEKTLSSLKSREYASQMVSPPILLTLSGKEETLLKKYMEYFVGIGFEIEHFGGREYAVRGVPSNLLSIAQKELLMEMIDGLSDGTDGVRPEILYERVASMSCKAAVKGNHAMSPAEADELIDLLLKLENPYNCPHGRPTIISMGKYELEKKFKRIV